MMVVGREDDKSIEGISSSPPTPPPPPPGRNYILRTNPVKFRADPNQWDLSEVNGAIYKYKNKSTAHSQQILPLRWGYGSLGLASSLTATYVNWHFRETLYLLSSFRGFSYMAMFGVPGLTAAAAHYMLVTRRVLVEKKGLPVCPVCLQVESAVIQGITGIIYPIFLAPLISYPIARRLRSYSLPTSSSIPTLLKFTGEMLRPIKGPLWTLAAVQVILGMGVAAAEQHSFISYLKPFMALTGPPLSPFDHREKPITSSSTTMK